MKGDRIVEEFKANNQLVIKQQYLRYRDEFVLFLRKKYGAQHETGLEIYHEAFYILYQNIISNKLNHLTSTLKTYLFQIGRNQFLNETKRNKRHTNFEPNTFDSPASETNREQTAALATEIIQKALKDLGDKCRDILKLFYFEKLRNDEIMERLNYATVDSVKTQKYKCFQQLKNAVTSKHSLSEMYD